MIDCKIKNSQSKFIKYFFYNMMSLPNIFFFLERGDGTAPNAKFAERFNYKVYVFTVCCFMSFKFLMQST